MNNGGMNNIADQRSQSAFVFPTAEPTTGPALLGPPLQRGPDPIQVSSTTSVPNVQYSPGLAPGLAAPMEDPNLIDSMGSVHSTRSVPNMEYTPGLAPGVSAPMDPRLVQSIGSVPTMAARQVEVPQVPVQPEFVQLYSERPVYPPAGSFQYNTGGAMQPQRLLPQPQYSQQVVGQYKAAPRGFGGYSPTWSYGLFECCSPLQCLAAFCCPCLVTYELFSTAVPFELAGFGCFAAAGSAMMMTVLVYCLYLFSFSLLFYVLMLSAIVGIKKKLALEENDCLTCFKICCCFCCYQIQILRQMELVGWPTAVTKQEQVQYGVQYGTMPSSEAFQQPYQPSAYLQPHTLGCAPPQQQALMYRSIQQPTYGQALTR